MKGFVANYYDGDIVKAVTITQNMNLCFSSNDQEFWNCCWVTINLKRHHNLASVFESQIWECTNLRSVNALFQPYCPCKSKPVWNSERSRIATFVIFFMFANICKFLSFFASQFLLSNYQFFVTLSQRRPRSVNALFQPYGLCKSKPVWNSERSRIATFVIFSCLQTFVSSFSFFANHFFYQVIIFCHTRPKPA